MVVNDIIWLLLCCYKTIGRLIKLIALMMNIGELLLRLQELICIIITAGALLCFTEVYLWVVHGSERVILGWGEALAVCLGYAHVLISFAW